MVNGEPGEPRELHVTDQEKVAQDARELLLFRLLSEKLHEQSADDSKPVHVFWDLDDFLATKPSANALIEYLRDMSDTGAESTSVGDESTEGGLHE